MEATMEFEIIDAKTVPGGHIILCHLPYNRTTPWATWWTKEVAGLDTDRHSGHYHRSEEAAKADFESRKF
jgi:hypothetical protein